MMFLLVFLLDSRMLQVQIKVYHLLNLRKTLLRLGCRIRQQAMFMQLRKMPILLPLKCFNLIKEAEMVPHLKVEYQLLSMQV